VPRRKVILALLLAATWITNVLHVELEMNGLIAEHEHRTEHEHNNASSHDHAVDDEFHEEVVARSSGSGQETRLGGMDLSSFPVIGLLTWLACLLPLRLVEVRPPPKRRDALASSSWQFEWRCVSFATAPPALS
jgi:hypothetical protein